MSLVFRPTILYVDDEPSNTLVFQKAFENEYVVKVAQSGDQALDIIDQESFALCLVDQRMPGMTGIELCEQLIQRSPETVRVMVTAYQEPELLLDAISKGHVFDYVVKPWKKAALQQVIQLAFAHYKSKALKLKELESRVEDLQGLLRSKQDHATYDDWIGANKGLSNVRKTLEQAAPTDSTIMIYGETGTGKERIAQLVHDLSPRSCKPFVPVHCAGLSPTLMESELFGHEKGAFTGADQSKKGLFEMAHGGTVFLDEIGEISEDVQVKLLRVLQEKQIQRVGSTQTVDVDIRIVGATNKDLEEKVKQGSFRSDLFYRLNVIPIEVPPLRDRMEDFEDLVNHFVNALNQRLGKNVSLEQEAWAYLQSYDWPGNVRELQNVLERAMTLAITDSIDVEGLRLQKGKAYETETVHVEKNPASLLDQMKQNKRDELAKALMEADGNVAKAARNMNMARSTLYDQLKKYKLI